MIIMWGSIIIMIIMWGSIIIIIMWGSWLIIMVMWGSWFFFQDELNSKSRELFNDCQKAVKDFLGGQCCSIIPTDQSINLPINQLIRWSSVQGVSNVNVFPSIPSGGLYPITSPMSPTTFPEFCSVVTTIWLPVHSDQPFLPQSLPFQLSHHLIFFVQDRFLAQASFFHQQYLRLIFFQWKNLERQPVTYKTFRMYRVLGEIPLMLLIWTFNDAWARVSFL